MLFLLLLSLSNPLFAGGSTPVATAKQSLYPLPNIELEREGKNEGYLLIEPDDRVIVSSDQIIFRGKAKPKSRVMINDIPALVKSDGLFYLKQKSHYGYNFFCVTADNYLWNRTILKFKTYAAVPPSEQHIYNLLGILNPPVEQLLRNPGEYLTRGEFALMLVFPDWLDVKPVSSNALFTDVPSQSAYCKYLNFLYQNGILPRSIDSKYYPGEKITRTDAIAMFSRLAGDNPWSPPALENRSSPLLLRQELIEWMLQLPLYKQAVDDALDFYRLDTANQYFKNRVPMPDPQLPPIKTDVVLHDKTSTANSVLTTPTLKAESTKATADLAAEPLAEDHVTADSVFITPAATIVTTPSVLVDFAISYPQDRSICYQSTQELTVLLKYSDGTERVVTKSITLENGKNNIQFTLRGQTLGIDLMRIHSFPDILDDPAIRSIQLLATLGCFEFINAGDNFDKGAKLNREQVITALSAVDTYKDQIGDGLLKPIFYRINNITRLEVIKAILALEGIQVEHRLYQESPFEDLSVLHPAFNQVIQAYDRGICKDRKIRPEEPITRYELVGLLWNIEHVRKSAEERVTW